MRGQIFLIALLGLCVCGCLTFMNRGTDPMSGVHEVAFNQEQNSGFSSGMQVTGLLNNESTKYLSVGAAIVVLMLVILKSSRSD